MSRKKTKLSREDWLAKALVILAKNGGHLNIDSLVQALGVTKGSFYWHFKNRDEFVNEVIDFWFHEFTEKAGQTISKTGDSPADQILALMLFIHEHALARYDIAFRSWAAQDAKIAKKIKKVDTFRLDFVRTLFAALGFKDQNLEMRSRLFTVYHSLNHGFFNRPAKEQELAIIKKQHALLIKK